VIHLKMRAALLGIVALFIVSGTMTSVASAAPFWHVNGTKLATGTEKQIKLQTKGPAVFTSESLGVEWECKNSIFEGATINNATGQGQSKGRISYSSCKVITPTSCTLAEPLTTKPLKAYLAEELETGSKNWAEVFEPTEGTIFFELRFTGTGCGILAGSQPIKGGLAAEIIPKSAEHQEGLLNFPSTAITKVKHEGTEKTIAWLIASTAVTFKAVYGARLAEFPTAFGVFAT
jgi:hypothetical protein